MSAISLIITRNSSAQSTPQLPILHSRMARASRCKATTCKSALLSPLALGARVTFERSSSMVCEPSAFISGVNSAFASTTSSFSRLGPSRGGARPHSDEPIRPKLLRYVPSPLRGKGVGGTLSVPHALPTGGGAALSSDCRIAHSNSTPFFRTS